MMMLDNNLFLTSLAAAATTTTDEGYDRQDDCQTYQDDRPDRKEANAVISIESQAVQACTTIIIVGARIKDTEIRSNYNAARLEIVVVACRGSQSKEFKEKSLLGY